VVLGKWLEFAPQIILFDEPTKGIDVGTKAEIYRIMGELVKQGITILMVSSELPEILAVTDRILVMREGVMRKILKTAEATSEGIMRLAALNS
jgi:ABC-type sugar transport system ATPase subunit